MKLVDLSHPFDPALHAAKAGEAKAAQVDLEIRRMRTVEEHGVNTLQITFGNHIGTHLDAPLHLIGGGRSVDELPLELFYGTTVVLDIQKGPNGAVSRGDLEAAQPAIRENDIVLVCTGWGDKLAAPNYASHHPYLTIDGAQWLAERRVRMVGMDVQSVDLPHSLRTAGFRYTSLRVLLEHGIPAIHNLTRLEAVAGRRVTLSCFPINFRGADGSPARVVAHVE